MAGSKCCGGSGCSCKVVSAVASDGNLNVRVTGAGSATVPITIVGAGIDVADTTSIDLTISYDAGINQYTLQAGFAATSSIDNLGNVNAPAPTSGQVLSWNSGSSKWVAAAPTVAPTGAVNHDSSLSGDGSGGVPLVVRHSSVGGTTTRVDGIGLNDATLNSIVRTYADASGRSSDPLPPDLNTLSVLDDTPGQVDYWDGSAWQPLILFTGETGVALFEQSGAYPQNSPTFAHNVLISDTTDGDGRVTLLDSGSSPFSTAAGILDYSLNLESGYPYVVCYDMSLGNLDAILYVFSIADSAFIPAASVAVEGKLRAILY